MRLFLVRHAQPTDDVRGRCYGTLDVGLSEAGRREVEALSTALAGEPVTAVVSSPARRACETAAPIAAAHRVAVEIDDGLRELDFGELEGRTYDEIAESLPALYAEWMTSPTTVRFPGGEGYEDLRQRAQAAVAALRARYEGGLVVAVTHGGVVRAVVAGVLGIPSERIFRLAVDHVSTTVVEWLAGEPVVRELNRPPGPWRGPSEAAPGPTPSPSTIAG